jgi:hypothetical protein
LERKFSRFCPCFCKNNVTNLLKEPLKKNKFSIKSLKMSFVQLLQHKAVMLPFVLLMLAATGGYCTENNKLDNSDLSIWRNELI